MTKSASPTPANPSALGLDHFRAQNQAMFTDFRDDMRANTAELRADVRRMTATLTQETARLGQSLSDVHRSVNGLKTSVNKVTVMLIVLVAVLAFGVVAKKAQPRPAPAPTTPQIVIIQPAV